MIDVGGTKVNNSRNNCTGSVGSDLLRSSFLLSNTASDKPKIVEVVVGTVV